MLKAGIRNGSLSFDILRFSILRFCGFAGRRRSKRSLSNRLKKNPFNLLGRKAPAILNMT